MSERKRLHRVAVALLVFAAMPCWADAIIASGLRAKVEVIRDRWGVAHIYASNTHDLFFAQGFVAAQGHMWSMELWRRNGEGRLAEVLGPKFVERDRYARLLKYRGDWDVEVTKYHPEGAIIFQAFAEGVNAAISLALASKTVPQEFAASGFLPSPDWTIRSVLTRLSGIGISGDATTELARALAAKRMGLRRAQDIMLVTEPQTSFVIPDGLDLEDLDPSIFDLARGANDIDYTFDRGDSAKREVTQSERFVGSNAWVVSGSRTNSGKPLLANDPHRPVRNPSLRYWVHLVAPGWNVIGATEPGLPGISIGHNEHVAWGFTAMGADQQDLYVEQLHPQDSKRYRYKNRWLEMSVEREIIHVRGAPSESFDVKSTRHGPVLKENSERHRAYALRWTGLEPGGAGYIGSLAVMQAKNWQQFGAGVGRGWGSSHALHYVDVEGNYGLMTAGYVPVRDNWDGLFPVPGNKGAYEWKGLRPAASLPRTLNDPRGFYATANNDVFSTSFPEIEASVARSWRYGAPYRYERIIEVLREHGRMSIDDMTRLQSDVVSVPARRLVPLLTRLKSNDPRTQTAIDRLAKWDMRIEANSVSATIFEYWLLKLKPLSYAVKLPEPERATFTSYDIRNVLAWMQTPDADFGVDPLGKRDELLLTALDQALTHLEKMLGADPSRWTWGSVHRMVFTHPLQRMDRWAPFTIPAIERAGDGWTVKVTSDPSESTADQSDGASIAFVMDPSNWDNSVGINTPGNETLTASPHYADLAMLWARDERFPLAFSRAKVESVAERSVTLQP